MYRRALPQPGRLMGPPRQEWTDYRIAGDRGIELLHAHYVHHAYERHAHDSYALGVTETGVQSFTYRGAYHASAAGTALALLPGEVHDGHAGAPDGFTYRMLYIEPDAIADALADAMERPAALPFVPQPLMHDRVLARLIRQLHQSLAAPESALERDALFQETVLAFARHADGPYRLPSVPAARPALERVRDFLHGNAAVDVSADDLARVAGMSRFHVSRQFRRAYGMAPHAYLLKLRLAEARRLIAAGEPMASAAAGAGFVDQSHLSKRFKGAFGITPGQYARAVRGAVTRR